MRTYLLLAILGSLLFGSCKKENPELPVGFYAYDYFPLAIGKYWTYQIDSVIFDPSVSGHPFRISSNLVKTTMIDTFFDGSGLLNYVVEYAIMNQTTQQWEPAYLGRASRSVSEAFLDEAGRKLVKMTFPPVAGAHWDGTRYINQQAVVYISGEPIEMFKDWDPRIVSTDEPGTIGNASFDKILTIEFVDTESRIEKRLALEKYIRGVGLAFREYWILDTQLNTDERPWDQKAQRGFILTQQLMDHN